MAKAKAEPAVHSDTDAIGIEVHDNGKATISLDGSVLADQAGIHRLVKRLARAIQETY